jgi:hypothetical protein
LLICTTKPPPERFFAVDRVSVAPIDRDVRSKQLVGVEPELRQSKRCRQTLRMLQQDAAISATLESRQHRYVFNEKIVRPTHGLDQRCQFGVDEQQIDHVLADRPIVVGRHRGGLAPDQRNPLGIGRAGQLADGGCIVLTGSTDLDAL